MVGRANLANRSLTEALAADQTVGSGAGLDDRRVFTWDQVERSSGPMRMGATGVGAA